MEILEPNLRPTYVEKKYYFNKNEDCNLISWKSGQSEARCAEDRILSNLRWKTRFPTQQATDCRDFHEIKGCQNQDFW